LLDETKGVLTRFKLTQTSTIESDVQSIPSTTNTGRSVWSKTQHSSYAHASIPKWIRHL